MRVQFVETQGPEDFDRAFSEMTRARAGALTMITSSMLFSQRKRLVDLAAKNRLPAMYTAREFVDAGGSMSYCRSPSRRSRYTRTGRAMFFTATPPRRTW